MGRSGAFLCAVLLLGGCGLHDATPDGEVVFLLPTDPTNLDPRLAPDAYSDRIARLIYATLLERQADGRLAPSLAETIERPDPQTTVVTLRDDARFEDGSPLRAQDVVASFLSVLDPELNSVKRLFLEPVEQIEAQGEQQVVFRLKRPHAPFDQVLAGIGILPEAAAASNPLDLELAHASGPFSLGEHRLGESVLLQANPQWFGGETGVERIRFRVVPDATVRVLELMHGSADITQNDLPPHVVERLKNEPGLRVDTGPSNLIKYLAFNLDRPALADLRVRQAIALALDIKPIIRFKLRGFAAEASGFLPPESWAYTEGLQTYDHDPERARRLLDSAGYPEPEAGGTRLSLVYRTSLDTTSVAVARIFKRQLAEVGIDMEIRSNEWGVFFSDIKQGDFDLYTLTGVGINDPDWLSFILHSRSMPPYGANRPRYRNEDVDRLLDEGKVLGDPSERAEAYRSVQRIVARDLPFLPLWFQQNVAVSRDDVVGYVPRPGGGLQSLRKVRKVRTR